MIKRYAKYQWKQWLPLFAVFAVFMGLIFVFACAITPMSRLLLDKEYAVGPTGANLLLALGIPAYFCSAAMALFVYSYRTSKKAADTFYQVPAEGKAIKQTRILLGLFILLASFTIAFVLGVGIYLVRYLATPEKANAFTEDYIYLRTTVNFGWYPLAYLLMVLILAGNYFMNLFLVGHGDYLFDQLCLLVFGNAILSLIVISPHFFIEASIQVFTQGRYTYGVEAFLYGLGPVTPFMFLEASASHLIGGAPFDSVKTVMLHSGISTGFFFIACALAAVYDFRSHDPSGEYANLHGARNKWVALIPHAAALLVGIIMAAVSYLSYFTAALENALVGASYLLIIGTVFSFLLDAAVYYIALSLWRLNFKPTKWDLKWYFIVLGIVLTLILFASISGYVMRITAPIYY